MYRCNDDDLTTSEIGEEGFGEAAKTRTRGACVPQLNIRLIRDIRGFLKLQNIEKFSLPNITDL